MASSGGAAETRFGAFLEDADEQTVFTEAERETFEPVLSFLVVDDWEVLVFNLEGVLTLNLEAERRVDIEMDGEADAGVTVLRRLVLRIAGVTAT